MTKFFKSNYHILTYILLYSSLIIAFFLDENVTSGAKSDLKYILYQVSAFEKDLLHSFLNYDTIHYTNRLSPIYIIFLTLCKKLFVNFDLARFFLIHLLIFSQFYFYKCLKLIYLKKFLLNKKILFLFSCVIFLSPSFRANVIWVESSMFGLLFFIIGLYFYLKNFKNFKLKNVFLNILFVAIAAYFRPSYCLFSLYFFFGYFFNFKDKISIYIVAIINLILAFPAIYYVFILKIFFIRIGLTNTGEFHTNYFDKIAIISSIIFFHTIPFLMYQKFSLKKNWLIIFSSLLFALILAIFFKYNLDSGGGGLALHMSHFITNNNYLFFLYLPIFIFYILQILKLNIKNNLLIILILFLITPQYHVFHKYYDPLVFILCLTIIDFKLLKDFFVKKRFVLISYFLFLSHYLISFVNSYYIRF